MNRGWGSWKLDNFHGSHICIVPYAEWFDEMNNLTKDISTLNEAAANKANAASVVNKILNLEEQHIQVSQYHYPMELPIKIR